MPQKKWTQVLIIFFVSTFIWGMIAPNSGSFGVVHGGELLGAGSAFLLFGLLIAHIPATIVRFTSGSWPTWQIWLSVPFIALFMYFAYIDSSRETIAGQEGASSQINSGGYWFSEEECELTVRFPGRPTYRIFHGQDGIQMRQAHFNTDDGFHLRAECTDYGGIWDGMTVSARDEDWIPWMRAFMSAEGMSNAQISTEDPASSDHDWLVVDGRGYKIVGGVDVTYRVRLLAAAQSVMILYGGGPSSRFPSRDISDFFESYR